MITPLVLVLIAQAAIVASSVTSNESIFDAHVTLDNGIFTGTALLATHRFLGIPFAKPPVGDLRFRLPVPNAPYVGNYNAKHFGRACSQQSLGIPVVPSAASPIVNYIADAVISAVLPDSEDCLTINVIKPSSAGANSKLPVVVWIYGGGFEIGGSSTYDGSAIVIRSIALGKPVIFVSMNYRVSAFGFLAGKEVKAERVGNLGLQDQREAFRWVQKYIHNFGGDPSKVTIFGESAGAISVSLHMLANGGTTDGLFRAGMMMSGGPYPVGDLASQSNQEHYDNLVRATGCDGSNSTLACLRQVDYSVLKRAVLQSTTFFSYPALNFAWLPRADGYFLRENPQKLAQEGKIANIPFIAGNCDDEGTIFSLTTLNVTTDEQLKTWLGNTLLPATPGKDIDKIMELYPSDVTQGSPFGTGHLYSLTPQSKRIAAIQGDGFLQAPRRLLMKYASLNNTHMWGYLSKRFKALPYAGSAHFTDVPNMFGGLELAEALIRLATDLDPNAGRLIGVQWPRYDPNSPVLYLMQDGILPVTTIPDTHRQEPMEYITQVTLANPV